MGPTSALPRDGPKKPNLGPLGAMGGFFEPSWGHFGTAPKSTQNQQTPLGKSMFLSVCGRLVCLCGNVLKDLPGYLGVLKDLPGYLGGVLGMLGVMLGILGSRLRLWIHVGPAWANQRVHWARPGRVPESSLRGGGACSKWEGGYPPLPGPIPQRLSPARGWRITPHTPSHGSADFGLGATILVVPVGLWP